MNYVSSWCIIGEYRIMFAGSGKFRIGLDNIFRKSYPMAKKREGGSSDSLLFIFTFKMWICWQWFWFAEHEGSRYAAQGHMGSWSRSAMSIPAINISQAIKPLRPNGNIYASDKSNIWSIPVTLEEKDIFNIMSISWTNKTNCWLQRRRTSKSGWSHILLMLKLSQQSCNQRKHHNSKM